MTHTRTNNNLLWPSLPYRVFFTISFIYFGFIADYILFYQEKASLFIFSFEFLLDNLNQPGGLMIYLGKFFSAFFFYPVAGAFIVSATLTLIVWTISKIIFIMRGKEVKVLPFIIGMSLFYLQSDYRFLFFFNLGLLLQLVFVFVTIKYLSALKGWIPVILIPLWYFATGGFAWVFSIMLTFYYLLKKDRKESIKIIALWLLNLITFYVSKEFLFFQPVRILLIYPFSEVYTFKQSIVLSTVAALLSFLPLISGIKLNSRKKLRISNFTIGLITTALLIVSLLFVCIIQYDKKTKQYFTVEKLFYQNKFDEVIAYNTINPSTNSLTIFLNNIALCERDKLNDMLFHFLQSPEGNTLFLKWEMYGEVLKRGGYFYYTIGMVNEAHRWAFENMVMRGHSPENVKMLIRTYLINGNYDVASKYIAILQKSLCYRKEAKAFERLLFNDAAIEANQELGEKRNNRLEVDFFSITDDPYVNIERILANDSFNKKAFEYKLAFMLLAKDYQGIRDDLPKLESFGFTRIPTHIEEAAMVLSLLDSGKAPELGKLQINPNTALRWNQYLTLLKQFGNDPKRAEPALRRQFGNSYWYYSVYR